MVRSQQSAGDPKLRYCASLGHKQDDETGLIYMRARYYEPTSGRFVSQDRAMHGRNWFAYCTNNPVNRIDPNGCEDGPFDGNQYISLICNLSGGVGTVAIAAGMALLLVATDPESIATASSAITIGLGLTAFGFDVANIQNSHSTMYNLAVQAVLGTMLKYGTAAMLGAANVKAAQLFGGLALSAAMGCFAYSLSCMTILAEMDMETFG